MRVLCITNGYSDDKDTNLVKRGSVYNVTSVVKGKYNKQHKTDIWYELLETGKDLHLGTLFVLAPAEENEPTSFSRKILEKAMNN